MRSIGHFIGGKHVNGTSGRFGGGFEPMTGEAVSRVPYASKAEVRAAVENARPTIPARIADGRSGRTRNAKRPERSTKRW